jgi:ERCC4-related helicase
MQYTLIAKKKPIACINTDIIDTNNKDFSEVYLRLVELENSVESNPDVIEIINTLEQEYQRQQDDSRSIIFVKRRATAKALAERLPQYLKSLYLTGKRSKDTCGMYIRSYKLV